MRWVSRRRPRAARDCGTGWASGRRRTASRCCGDAPSSIAFAGMDDRGPAEPEAVVVRADFELGVAHLLDEEAIVGMNLRRAAKMPNEIGNRQHVRGLTEMAFGDKGEAYDRRRGPSQPTSQDIALPGGNARRHRQLRIVQTVRSVLHLAKRQHRGDYPNSRDRYILSLAKARLDTV